VKTLKPESVQAISPCLLKKVGTGTHVNQIYSEKFPKSHYRFREEIEATQAWDYSKRREVGKALQAAEKKHKGKLVPPNSEKRRSVIRKFSRGGAWKNRKGQTQGTLKRSARGVSLKGQVLKNLTKSKMSREEYSE